MVTTMKKRAYITPTVGVYKIGGVVMYSGSSATETSENLDTEIEETPAEWPSF